ncbi:MAG: hypothetical protein WKG06_23965 [Segetibacter sp.]
MPFSSSAWIKIGFIVVTGGLQVIPTCGPGKYVSAVKASNNDGAWNEQGASVSIVILPPWWRTWWAYTILTVLFAGLIYVFIRYRINKIRMQHEIVVQKHKATELEMQALRAQMNSTLYFQLT